MAVLSAADLALVGSRYQTEICTIREIMGLTKSEFAAAVSAIDSWVDTNAVAFNLAIPLPARTTLTARQKARLLVFVVQRRYEIS